MPRDQKESSSKLVWYACYGSNLNYERFMCYIQGGLPPGRSERNNGCRCQSPPKDSRTISLKFGLYFAAQTDLESNAPSEEYARTIAAGIKETYSQMSNEEVAAYLPRADGLRGKIDLDDPTLGARRLKHAKETLNRKRVYPFTAPNESPRAR
jgi:hypothetical protein